MSFIDTLIYVHRQLELKFLAPLGEALHEAKQLHIPSCAQ